MFARCLTMIKRSLLLSVVLLAGCVAYYPAPSSSPDPRQAQAAADAQCAKSGKVAVLIVPATCSASNCTTTFECR